MSHSFSNPTNMSNFQYHWYAACASSVSVHTLGAINSRIWSGRSLRGEPGVAINSSVAHEGSFLVDRSNDLKGVTPDGRDKMGTQNWWRDGLHVSDRETTCLRKQPAPTGAIESWRHHVLGLRVAVSSV